MKTNKIAACLLAGTMILSGGLSAFANDVMLIAEEAPVVMEQQVVESVYHSATVKEIITEDEAIVSILCKTGEEEIQFNVGEETVVINNETKLADSLSEIKENDEIIVYAAPMMTMSIPAQSPALVILTNLGEKAPAKFITVAKAEEKEGVIEITDTEGNYIVRATEETEVLPYRTRNIVFASDIKEGSKILFWSEVMTLSLPAQAAADAIVILPEAVVVEDAEETEEEVSGTPAVNDVLEIGYTKDNGVEMIPVRKTFEALGFEVMWDDSQKRVDLIKGARTFTINIGSCDYGVSKMIVKLDDAAEIVDGRTYAPKAFFDAAFAE